MTEAKPLRMTKQRQIILEELRKLKTHPTARELYELVRSRLARISLGTVYRNLDVLTRAGLVQKLDVAGTEKRFDGTREEHYHIRCIRCGKVADMPLDPIPALKEAVQKVTGFTVTSHRVEFLGICDACAGNSMTSDLPNHDGEVALFPDPIQQQRES